MLTSRRAKLESCRQPHGLPLFQASAGLDQARGNELQRRLEAWRHWGSGVGTELSWEWRVKLGQRLSCGGNTAPKPDLYGCLLFQTEMWIKVRRAPAWRFTFFGQKQMVSNLCFEDQCGWKCIPCSYRSAKISYTVIFFWTHVYVLLLHCIVTLNLWKRLCITSPHPDVIVRKCVTVLHCCLFYVAGYTCRGFPRGMRFKI